MTMKPRDLRALVILGLGLLGLIVYRLTDSTPSVVAVTESPASLENRLTRLRSVAATVPAKSKVYHGVSEQLKAREKSMMVFATAPQAQAHLLEVIRRVGSLNKIEPRGGDFAAPALLGTDYGQVAASVNFECTIEEFVNFLADLSKEPELIAPSEVHISAGNVKVKTINVRMTLAGVVPKKLVPERKSIAVL